MAMAEELEALGGFGSSSTARLSGATTIASIFSSSRKKQGGSGSKGDSTVTTSSKCSKSCFVTVAGPATGELTCKLSASVSKPVQLNDHLSCVTDWILDDFNGAVLSFGCDSHNRINASAGKYWSLRA